MATNNQRLSNLGNQVQEQHTTMQQMQNQLGTVSSLQQGLDAKMEMMMKNFEAFLAIQRHQKDSNPSVPYTELSKTLKEGERILAPTRRPDGTLCKPIRIRAGYVPQDEVAIYQSKGALWKKEMASQEAVPPGYDPVLDAKPKTKSAKRNERKKEKRLQAALDKGKNLEQDEVSSAEDVNHVVPVELVASQLNEFTISANSTTVSAPSNSTECLNSQDPAPDIDKRIRALKKKVRLTEAQKQKLVQEEMKPEQLDKLAKLEDWRKELKLLEDKKAELAAL